jgi:hypothetical protein
MRSVALVQTFLLLQTSVYGAPEAVGLEIHLVPLEG